MHLKTNMVIGAIFLGLLAFVYFYEIKGGEERRSAAEKAKEMLSFSDHEAKKLVLDRGDTLVVLEKRQDSWWLKKPVETEADQAAIGRLLRNLRESKRERVIADSAQVAGDSALVARYGLQPPRLKVRLETAETAFDTLFFGAETPTERFVYMQQRGANPEIFLLRAWRFDNLDKGVFDLRDRRVLAFEPEQVRQLRLVRPSGRVVLIREQSGAWRLSEPVQAAADTEEVEALLKSLKSARIEAFVDEKPGAEALARAGLAGGIPLVDLSLLVGEDRAEKRLRIGAAAESGRYHALDSSRPPLFLVDSTLVHKVQKELFDLRDKTPLHFESDAVTRVELEGKGGRLVAEKDSSDTWALVEPEKRRAKSWKIDGLLSDLEEVKVEEFIADGVEDLASYGLDDPPLKIVLKAADKVVLEARLRKTGKGEVQLARVGVPSVYRVEQAVWGDLDLGLDDIAQPPSRPAESTPADTAGPQS